VAQRGTVLRLGALWERQRAERWGLQRRVDRAGAHGGRLGSHCVSCSSVDFGPLGPVQVRLRARRFGRLVHPVPRRAEHSVQAQPEQSRARRALKHARAQRVRANEIPGNEQRKLYARSNEQPDYVF
jgi:hypothetical protein